MKLFSAIVYWGRWLVRPGRQRLALLWALGTALVAAVTAPAVGVSRDEGVYFVAAESYVNFNPARTPDLQQLSTAVDRSFSVNHEHPPLAKEVYGFTHRIAQQLGIASHMQGFRLGAFLFAAFLSWVLALFAWDYGGRGAALLAPALFWLVPRHFYHAHPAALDMPMAAMWLATVYVYWKSRTPESGRLRASAFAVATGILFGAAVSVKHNGWFLPPLLLIHWAASDLLERCNSAPAVARPRGLPLAFFYMALLGPVIFVVAWPWLWFNTFDRVYAYVLFHLQHENYPWHYLGAMLRDPPFPAAYPFVVTALTVPAAILAAMAGGLIHAAARLVAAIRNRLPKSSISDELLLMMNALFPVSLIAWPWVPHFGGVKHWLPAMPFLAILAARALVTTGRILWPAQQRSVTAALAFFTLAPALWAVVHTHPFGTAAYNEIAGGAPGAASLGMQRQFWGDNLVAALEALNQHAVPGARIWYQEAAPTAVLAYQRDGRLRQDLRWADGPETADISVHHYHQEFRDREFVTWTEFHSARPVYGVYLDEVPLIQVYARPGAWR